MVEPPLKEHDRAILRLLAVPGTGYVSPTRIAQALHPGTGRHSAWASPKCLRLRDRGLLQRNERGWYGITHEGRNALVDALD